ncbi:hypothetical protein GLOTRDRAFT_94730 [Gloeophyllum trabeum ATCC 11539]|uniref:Uncharacterized protein n=1 Tax=Gloeophyllum trabeum (strain ATCC 11539 / FP-39264 / Madison 617) TaxID=670483 RepID=S7Q1U8_GLOTA|nr:uncharacterized protein GLOTRDRAFT_94730 [Gloeophyllum trabeum ATCC 11539]EPQ53493.1 hypothetical protein GLOTRDRAFT_94730 [Gloeophyllum trabeum ATCC 11539]
MTKAVCDTVGWRFKALKHAALTKIDETLEKLTSKVHPMTPANAASTTYRNTVTNHGPATQEATPSPAITQARAQAEIKTPTRVDLVKLADKTLCDKVNEVIRDLCPDNQCTCNISAATKLTTGSILYENTDAFKERFHAHAIIHNPQPYPVVAEFVPVQFNPSCPEDLCEVEELIGYPSRSITQQRLSHLPEMGQSQTRHSQAHPMREMPVIWSYHSQLPIDMRGTCGGNHRTATCNSDAGTGNVLYSVKNANDSMLAGLRICSHTL